MGIIIYLHRLWNIAMGIIIYLIVHDDYDDYDDDDDDDDDN